MIFLENLSPSPTHSSQKKGPELIKQVSQGLRVGHTTLKYVFGSGGKVSFSVTLGDLLNYGSFTLLNRKERKDLWSLLCVDPCSHKGILEINPGLDLTPNAQTRRFKDFYFHFTTDVTHRHKPFHSVSSTLHAVSSTQNVHNTVIWEHG